VRITAIDSIVITAPTGGLDWIGGRADTWDTALVRVETDEGLYGLGEVSQGASGAGAVGGIVACLLPIALGMDPQRPATVRHALYNRSLFWARGGISQGVISAIENACWDIAGKARGMPVHRLLGGPAREDIRVYASIGLGATEEFILNDVVKAQEQGYDLLKVRSFKNVHRTIELLEEVKRVLKPGTRILFDAIMGVAPEPWTFKEALAVGRKLETMDAVLFEEPCRTDDIDGYVELRKRLDVPIAGAETYNSRFDFQRIIDAGGVDVVQPDATIVGGISELLAVAAYAQSKFVRVVPHTWGSSVTRMTNWQAALSCPWCELVEHSPYTNPLVDALLVEGSLGIEKGRFAPPQAPGLGVKLDDEIIAKYSNYSPGKGIHAV
jgi:L-alanine-DL-glutamate epimerase-like enolase superfamily enzyme